MRNWYPVFLVLIALWGLLRGLPSIGSAASELRQDARDV
jgi:hypothetical protein